ncbi:MAG TPA: hypothetical protein DDY13_07785 [Cytophagales bacterium]|jgi:hypothetical protein|nr:hypothetical protein [Cytophagales bacterium]
MEYKDIAAVAGKGGLYKVVKPSRTGLILESLDDKKAKIVTGPHQRVSLMEEISIYTNDFDVTIPVADVFANIYEKFEGDPGVDSKSDKEELFAFFKEVAPGFDEDRVYPSDIKKIVAWYKILLDKAPELLKTRPEQEKKEDPEKNTKK